jgi:hypothetical protein
MVFSQSINTLAIELVIFYRCEDPCIGGLSVVYIMDIYLTSICINEWHLRHPSSITYP